MGGSARVCILFGSDFAAAPNLAERFLYPDGKQTVLLSQGRVLLLGDKNTFRELWKAKLLKLREFSFGIMCGLCIYFF